MTAGKPIAPEFGPNGAVMNGQAMTADMRNKIERSDPRHPYNHLPKPMRRLFLGVYALGLCLLAGSTLLRTEEPGIALVLALASLKVVLVNVAWRALALKELRRQLS
jgi:hypothetical protein